MLTLSSVRAVSWLAASARALLQKELGSTLALSQRCWYLTATVATSSSRPCSMVSGLNPRLRNFLFETYTNIVEMHEYKAECLHALPDKYVTNN